jgi:hypothetical protein
MAVWAYITPGNSGNRLIGSVGSSWTLRFILLRADAAARDKSSAVVSAVTIFMSLASSVGLRTVVKAIDGAAPNKPAKGVAERREEGNSGAAGNKPQKIFQHELSLCR